MFHQYSHHISTVIPNFPCFPNKIGEILMKSPSPPGDRSQTPHTSPSAAKCRRHLLAPPLGMLEMNGPSLEGDYTTDMILYGSGAKFKPYGTTDFRIYIIQY